MPIAKKKLHVGKTYRIEVTADAHTPDVSLVVRGWMPKSGAPTPPKPLTLEATPGGGDHDHGTVPECHALEIEWQVLEDPATHLSLVVTEEGNAVVSLKELKEDGFITVLVRK